MSRIPAKRFDLIIHKEDELELENILKWIDELSNDLQEQNSVSSPLRFKEIQSKIENAIKSENTYSFKLKFKIIDSLAQLYCLEGCTDSTKSEIIEIFWKLSGFGTPIWTVSDALRRALPTLLRDVDKVTDEKIITRLMYVIDNIAHFGEWNRTRKHLVKTGFLDQMTLLLDKWRTKPAVLLDVLWTLSNLTLKTTNFKFSEVKLPDGTSTNLPDILQKVLLETIPSEDNGSFLMRLLKNIQGLLFGSNFFHSYFTNQKFIDHLFVLLQSKHVPDMQKHKILFQIITNMLCNNPHAIKKLLVPHAKHLEDLASFHMNGNVSRAAATIVKKYMGCLKKKHQCRVITSTSKFSLAFFVLAYTADLFGDLKVGYNTITDSELKIPLKKEGYLLIAFSVLPLIYINILSYHQYKKSNHHLLYTDQNVSLDGNPPRRFTSYIFQWKWDSPKHAVLNILSLFQMRLIIAAVEIIYHKPQEMLSVLQKIFNFTRLNIQEKILENVPCIFLKLLIMYKTYKDIRDFNEEVETEEERRTFPRTDDYFTFITTVISVVSLISSLVKFEKLCRSATTSICSDLRKTSQVMALNLGYLTMITARIFTCLLLFHQLEAHSSSDSSGYGLFSLCITLHILLTFLSHIFSRHYSYDLFHGLYHERIHPVYNFIFKKYYNTLLRNPPHSVIKRLLLVFALSWGEFFAVMLRHPIEFLEGHPHVQHQRSGRYFALIYLIHLTEQVAVSVVCFWSHRQDTGTFHLGYISVGLYLVSGVIFLIYFRYLHPDNTDQQTFPSLHTNNRVQLINSSDQENNYVPLWQQFCNVTTDTSARFKVHGDTVYKAEQFNYRLQDMRVCVVCCEGLRHTETLDETQVETDGSGETGKNAEELAHLMRRVKNSKSLYAELPNLDQAVKLNSENPRFLELYRQNDELRSQIERKYEVLHTRLSQNPTTLSELGLQDFRETCQTYFYWSALQWESAVKENARRKPAAGHHVITVI